MERKIKPKVFAIDVGESRLVATKMEINNNTVKEADTREFKYNEEGLKELIKFLEGYEEGIMEATGVYFYHVYNVLRDNGLKVNVINPVQTVEVLGKKTDKNDSIRLAIAYAAGTVKGSYIPTGEMQELREMTRHREGLVERKTQVKNEIRKVLETAGYKLPPFEKKTKEIVRKLATDEKLTDEEIKEYSKLLGRKLTRIEAFILKQLLDLLNIIEEQIKEVENEIMKFLPEEAVELTKIPGIGPISAATIYAELGDVNRFESSKQAASYAGVSPRTKQSGKTEFHNGLIKGNKHLSRVLFLVARSAKNTAQFNGFYQALLKRTSNSKKATLALANKICRIVYHVLKDGEYKGETKKTRYRGGGGEGPQVDPNQVVPSALQAIA